MTGVEASEEMTMEQIEAMSGGELLRNEVRNLPSLKIRGLFLKMRGINCIEQNNKKNSRTLFHLGWLLRTSTKYEKIITTP